MEYLYDKQVEPGEFIEIAEGVLWLTMPLPFDLDHINLYLLKGEGGWVVLDTGIGTATTKSLWLRIFEQLNAPIVGVIVTHLHPDHVGLAGWIADMYNVPFYMTQTEYFTARAFAAPETKRDWTSLLSCGASRFSRCVAWLGEVLVYPAFLAAAVASKPSST